MKPDGERRNPFLTELKERYQSLSGQLEEEKGALIDTFTSLTSFKNRLSHLEERRKDLQKRMRSHEEESEGVRERLSRLEISLSETARDREEGRSVQSGPSGRESPVGTGA